jgi:hypothetical protein
VAVATTVWFMVTAAAKLTCDLWHESHLAVPAGTGIWVAGLDTALVLPLWQVSQVPVPTALAAEWVYCTLSQLLVERWQLSQFPVIVVWVDVAGLLVKPYAPLKWQVAHCVAIDTFLWKAPGNQLA